ncbi:PIR protein [Plasmodium yoelii]|uniref:PIR protein n=2 Tax=Plasmodium yoelii TaxID=5861 RepID=A0AAE9X290_PLAYO|nr:PIR protein [Plasmodium yoelii]WBY60533.1 PIR protein [Plasmodium yoelii yoelii]CDU20350.1 YIR protein [Plasmodium yoelii]VTZ81310.1 PIR protein [Plasmodium yoelii]|eukprot:XP_022810777.1 PIR protein [Plasmodium yoelii]
MNKQMCKMFLVVRNSISDKLDNNKNYRIINEQPIKEYCTNNMCVNELEKINAGCLFLFDALFKDSSVFSYYTKNNINIVKYIIIWLSYMLNLKEQVGTVNNLQYFYNMYMEGGDKYKNRITDIKEYSSYKDLIDKINMMNMDIKDISKFYDAFSTLCNMYIEFDEDSPNCNKFSEQGKEFVRKYEELKKNYNITEDSPYNQVLSILSTDYNNFKNKCKILPSLPTIDKKPHAQSSEATSSSSISKNLFIVLSIFGAIGFFLGISYKYSLFGFRKRFQKQKLREKLKNIKKRMNQ